jgi:hypothetical protein
LAENKIVLDPSLSIPDSLLEFRARPATTYLATSFCDDSVHGPNIRFAGKPHIRTVNERGDVDVNLLRHRRSGRMCQIFRRDSDKFL